MISSSSSGNGGGRNSGRTRRRGVGLLNTRLLLGWAMTLESCVATPQNPADRFFRNEDAFFWGVATAAYQTEGATAEDGRGPSIWDTFSALPGKIHNGDTGAIADDSYHKIAEDVQLIKAMGLKSYRFSISWSRIMPTGRPPVNPAGVAHYRALLDALHAAGITPLVTLYHWDLPQALEDRYRGWLSPQIEDDFVNYADTCFAAFGDRVKLWTTFNEPWTFCYLGYVAGTFAPGRCSDRTRCVAGNSSTEGYVAAHNVLNAHAAAVARYRTTYQAAHQGLIGMTLNQDWAAPLDPDNALDVQAAERRREFQMGWFADPIVFGDYPRTMRAYVGARLPTFTAAQRVRLGGSLDFFALNHYTTKYYTSVREDQAAGTGGGWGDDQRTNESKVDRFGHLIGPQAASPWLNVVPWGFYETLMWNTRRYRPAVILVTENGCDVPGENDVPLAQALDDQFRCVSEVYAPGAVALSASFASLPPPPPGPGAWQDFVPPAVPCRTRPRHARRGPREGLLRLVAAGQLRVGGRVRIPLWTALRW
jgi:beta-glucosidase